MKVSFGIITKNFMEEGTLDLFLNNAQKYGHKIHSVVIAYQNSCDFKLIEHLQNKVKVEVVKINHNYDMVNDMRAKGVSETDALNIIYSKHLEKTGYTPYGVNRNNVMVKAMLTGTEILIFIDTDVYPYILYEGPEGSTAKMEIDYVGEHLKYLADEKVAISTSDYSGYFIIPTMSFDGMDALFKGLQKDMHFNEMVGCKKRDCLIYGEVGDQRKPFLSHKILGGNLAIKLDQMKKLPPFYSSVFTVGKDTILTRGEDTLLGLAFKKNTDILCMDIDLKIFHDTFNNYPIKPDILKNTAIRDRFYYACMGWIGRNPFLNWLKEEDVKSIYEAQREALEIGSKAAANHFQDERFLNLLEAIDVAFENLGQMIDEYEVVMESWQKVTAKIL